MFSFFKNMRMPHFFAAFICTASIINAYAQEIFPLKPLLTAVGKEHAQLSLAFNAATTPECLFDEKLSAFFISFPKAQINNALAKSQIISSKELKNFGIESIVFSQKKNASHIVIFFSKKHIDATSYLSHWYAWENKYANPAEHYLEVTIYKSDFLKSLDSTAFLARTIKPCVVADPGHGGKALGATYSGLEEKNLNLDIARNLVKALQRNNLSVVLTRSDDSDVSLDERSKYGMNQEGNIFVSIHNNATGAPKETYPFIHGTETYRLPSENIISQCEPAHFAFIHMAPDENMIKLFIQHWQKQKIMSDLLANCIQKSIVSHIKQTTGYQLVDRGVKTAYFRVLRLNTPTIPAVLVENGYMCNAEECKKLSDPAFRKELAQAICKGIIDFLRDALSL